MNCGSPNVYDGCWRRMLVERPHLYFNGMYFSSLNIFMVLKLILIDTEYTFFTRKP